jgi:hypothetical protein
MQAPPYLCSICGAPKLSVNHWQMAVTRPGIAGISYQPIESVEEPRNPLFVYEELCGQACTHKSLDRYLGNLKAAPTATREIEEQS